MHIPFIFRPKSALIDTNFTARCRKLLSAHSRRYTDLQTEAKMSKEFVRGEDIKTPHNPLDLFPGWQQTSQKDAEP